MFDNKNKNPFFDAVVVTEEDLSEDEENEKTLPDNDRVNQMPSS